MSGHSKWAQIKRQKGVADVKRGMAFTKLANQITISVRDGGGITDPDSNFKLRLMMEKAKAANMPKENIQRAIERGKGMGVGGDVLTTIMYEGFGPGGTAFIIESITDNRQRAYSQIKNIVDKHGGTLAGQGAVSFMFTQMGLIIVSKNGKSLDDFMLEAAEAGAEDVEESDDAFEVYTNPGELNAVKTKLVEQGEKVLEAELFMKPNSVVKITDKRAAELILKFMDILEECDDVNKVHANFDIPADIMVELSQN